MGTGSVQVPVHRVCGGSHTRPSGVATLEYATVVSLSMNFTFLVPERKGEVLHASAEFTG